MGILPQWYVIVLLKPQINANILAFPKKHILRKAQFILFRE
jgi:hypothetical protein